MKKKTKSNSSHREPSQDEIRDYAFHLYEQSGCVPGRDLENWLEAKACLEANIPKQHAHTRLHHHRHPEAAATDGVSIVAIDAELAAPAGAGDEAEFRRMLVTTIPM